MRSKMAYDEFFSLLYVVRPSLGIFCFGILNILLCHGL